MFQIINEDEVVPMTKALIAVIYGEPGVCKTSLAFTAESPLLMDFDEGVLRAVGRKTTIKFDKWEDVNSFVFESDEIKKRGIKTLICDTGGTMLDNYLALHIVALDNKYGNGAGGLGLKGYGIQKSTFQVFLNRCVQMGIEAMIFICHTEEKGDGENAKHSPKLTGGSYDILMSKADLVGYIEMKNNKPNLNFSPTTRHFGKNSAEFKPFELPHYDKPEWAGYMGRILTATRDKMTRMSEAQVAAIKLVNQFSEQISATESTDELEKIFPEIEKLSPAHKIQVMSLYEVRYADLWKAAYFENVKTVDDFDLLAIAMKELSASVRNRMIDSLKELQAKHGVSYDKTAGKYVLKSEMKEASQPAQPSTDLAAGANEDLKKDEAKASAKPAEENKEKKSTKSTTKTEVPAQLPLGQ